MLAWVTILLFFYSVIIEKEYSTIPNSRKNNRKQTSRWLGFTIFHLGSKTLNYLPC